MTCRRLRYVCQAVGCDETNVTARGHAAHAERAHRGDDVEAVREWVEVGD